MQQRWGTNSTKQILFHIFFFFRETSIPLLWKNVTWWVFHACEYLGGKRSTNHTPPALSVFKQKSASVRYFYSLGQDQSTVAQRTETSCVWARFPNGFPTLHGNIVSPLRLRWRADTCKTRHPLLLLLLFCCCCCVFFLGGGSPCPED